MDNNSDIKNTNKNNVLKTIINVICKILLIVSFIAIVEILARGENEIIIPSVIFIITTIGILKTNQKKSKIFLILAIFSICIGIFIPLVVMAAYAFFMGFIKLFGGFKDISIIDTIMDVPNLLVSVENGILIEVILITIAIAFIFIHKKQKFQK